MSDRSIPLVSARSTRKVCVVTGSRADYGLLYWLMCDLRDSTIFELQVIATGMHLSPEFGMTVSTIEDDNFAISARVETLLSSDSAVGVAKATGLGIIGFADALQTLAPDLVILLGDRFEIFAAAQAAMFMRIPIAHIGGGDVTAGAFDEAMRHSISKMAQIHFVTNDAAAERLHRMGEAPQHIFNVGSPGLDHLHRVALMDRDTLARELGLDFRARNFLVTFHPVTLGTRSSSEQLDALLSVLASFDEDTGIIFTLPNADTESRALIQKIQKFTNTHNNSRAFESLGQARYLAAVAAADVVIGNSSSGLYEAPSLSTPTVNIGTRQEGRLKAESVFDCAAESSAIRAAINDALSYGKRKVENPYKKGDCANLIQDALKSFDDWSALTMKQFNDEPSSC